MTGDQPVDSSPTDAAEGKAQETGSPPSGDVAESRQQISDAADAGASEAPSQAAEEAPAFTQLERDWLRKVAIMLMAPTYPGESPVELQTQVGAILAGETPPAILANKHVMKIAQMIFRHLEKVCTGDVPAIDYSKIATLIGEKTANLRAADLENKTIKGA